jgi:L-alanine-DL-glutamate epimerase-like enolase superfamily enzyme
LRDELRRAKDAGFERCKIKVAGATLSEDQRRVDAALTIMGDGRHLAVDANAGLDRAGAYAYLQAFAQLSLAWLEEAADPLDYAAYNELAGASAMPLATGENVFSAADLANLLRYGGLKPERDLLQMDVALSYGIPEYLRMLALAETAGYSREQCLPHAGHVFALHVVAGLGLGAHETALDLSLPIAGFSDDCRFADGYVTLGDSPGAGIEAHPGLYALFKDILPAARAR